MKKILRTAIVCLLIPSFVFAQIPQYRGNEPSVIQTDLSQIWNALNTEVGQQIVSYVETTVGSIDLEHAKSFTTANGEIVFAPIKSFSRVLAALCYRQLEDGSEYLFLITYTAAEKAVSFTFPSGQMYIMKASGVTKSLNPDFLIQEYDDLNNRVGITANTTIDLLCSPVSSYINFLGYVWGQYSGCACFFPDIQGPCPSYCYLVNFLFFIGLYFVPLLFIVNAYSSQNSNLEMVSILFAVYYYGCLLHYIDVINSR